MLFSLMQVGQARVNTWVGNCNVITRQFAEDIMDK